MSSALALSGVTAILQFYLNNMYVSVQNQFSSQVTVSCLAPDQVQNGLGGAADVENQVNLFLHQVTHNGAWRNVDQPMLAADGRTRLKCPPLALDLHYLLTAYGSDFWQAEALLGHALMMLHEAPTLTRKDISDALRLLTTPPVPYPSNPLTKFIGSCGLADQIEMIKITPATLGREEMAWLWTALKADYRPTYPFQVSVVLMQPSHEVSFALPVLATSVTVRPVQPAAIFQLDPPPHQSFPHPGDTVTAKGSFLLGATRVVLTNPRHGIQLLVPVATATNTALTFILPAPLPFYPAGPYNLTVQFLDSTGKIVQQTTNALPLAVAPVLGTQVATVALNPIGTLVKLSLFSPDVRAGQNISLLLSTLVAPIINAAASALAFADNAPTLSFQFETNLPAGPYLGRLLVDGVTSQVQINPNVFPPKFLGPLVTL